MCEGAPNPVLYTANYLPVGIYTARWGRGLASGLSKCKVHAKSQMNIVLIYICVSMQ